MTKQQQKPDAVEQDYRNMLNLLAILTEASNQLDAMGVDTNNAFLEILDGVKTDYARLQQTVTETSAALEIIARRHPEWFRDAKTIDTPYGKISFRSSTVLDVPNEELSVVLIKQQIDAGTLSPEFLRSRYELDRELLEKLDDATLAQLRIKRVTKENFSAKPARVDLGKAVKEAVEKEAA